jgi:hypothetical protein
MCASKFNKLYMKVYQKIIKNAFFLFMHVFDFLNFMNHIWLDFKFRLNLGCTSFLQSGCHVSIYFYVL